MKLYDNFVNWLNQTERFIEEKTYYPNKSKMADFFAYLTIGFGVPSFLVLVFLSGIIRPIMVNGGNIVPSLFLAVWLFPEALFFFLWIYFTNNYSKTISRDKAK